MDVAVDLSEFVRWTRFAALLGAAAIAVIVWCLGRIMLKLFEIWRRNFLAEAELEFEEMLMQAPTERIFNYTLIAALTLSSLVFVLIAPGADGFNWRFGAFGSALSFVASVLGGRGAMKYMRKRRLERFNDQLEEALMSMGNALKAGFSINQAIEMVIKQNRNPISLEFKLMIQQTQLGMGFDDALHNMARRVKSEDFNLTASAIITARQTGGDLTGVFERLSNVIRERMRIQRRIRALTAQGRLQAFVLTMLPLALLGIIYAMDPYLVRTFFSQPLGIACLIVVVLLQIGAFLTIRKIVNIDI